MATKEIWNENFEVLPAGVTENVKIDGFNADGWEASITENGYSETDNYFVFQNNKLTMVKSQGEKSTNNIMAYKTIPEIDYTNMDEVIIEFDYSIDRPYNDYAYFPVIDIINSNQQQIYGLAFGSTHYGCFVIPHGKPHANTAGAGVANEDDDRVIARNNDTFLSLCDGGEMHIKICIGIIGGYCETTITKNGVTYSTPEKRLPLDKKLLSFKMKKIGLYAINRVQQQYSVPVVSTFDNFEIYSKNSVSGKFTDLANAVREKTGVEKQLSINEMTIEVGNLITAEEIIEDKLTDVVNNKATKIKQYLWANSFNITTAKFQNVTNVGAYAFYACAYLRTAELPSVTNIASHAFEQCFNLSTLIIGTKNCVLASWFSLDQTEICLERGYIYVPDDAVEWYKTATNWSGYALQIKPISELEE
ncbi:MAG: leucine-rich repeat protein [Clostridia bacterium]|nr:leucine-rich repeat protein [Clostridia bacterium]